MLHRTIKLVYLVADARYFCTHRLPLAVEAKSHGFDVHVICPSDHTPHTTPSHSQQNESINAILKAGITLHNLPFNRRSLNPLMALCTIYKIACLYRCIKPDIAHHVAIKPVLFGTIAARFSDVPHIINAVAGLGHVFASKSWLLRPLRLMMRFLLRSQRVTTIVQNPEDQVELEALTRKPIHLILGAGVDTALFSPIKQKMPSETEALVITHASRLLWSKGVGELVEATKILRNQGYAIKTQIVGMPDDQNPDTIPTSTLQAWHDEGIISWLGYQQNMAPIYQNTDIAVLASYYREGIPKTLIEAASVGLPIVTTDMPGCRIIVNHQKNGILIPPRNTTALTDALKILIIQADLRHLYGKKGRDRVIEEFSSQIIYKKTIAVYERVMTTESIQMTSKP